MADEAPTRPVLRWHGGKWRLAPWIVGHFPLHRVYVEPFGGAASVLLRKPRSYAEVYNDLDGEVVNFFRVLRDPPMAADLTERLRLTPFAREELEASYAATEDLIETARRLVVRSFMGFGSDGAISDWRAGFRSNSNRSGTTPAHDWKNYAEVLDIAIERLRGVVIESRDACAVMGAHDGPETLHYVDPPYVHATRKKARRRGGGVTAYRHEMSDDDHRGLLAFLNTLKGAVILSGYPNALYDETLTDWQRTETLAYADGAHERTEVIWLNPAVSIRNPRPTLFAGLMAQTPLDFPSDVIPVAINRSSRSARARS